MELRKIRGIETPLTNIVITDEDIFSVAKPGELPAVRSDEQVILSDEDIREKVMSLLPKAVAEKMKGFVPEGFEISEIEILVKFKGSPFNIGVDGQMKLKFTK